MEEDGERSIPVVMETGYFTRYQSMVQVRKQVRQLYIKRLWLETIRVDLLEAPFVRTVGSSL